MKKNEEQERGGTEDDKKKDKKITENHFSQLLILIHYNCAHKCIKALQWWDLYAALHV